MHFLENIYALYLFWSNFFQLKFQQLICTRVALATTAWTKSVCKPCNSLTNIHFKSGGWPGFEPGSLTFMASALTAKLPTKLVEMSAHLLTDGSRTFYQGLHCTYR